MGWPEAFVLGSVVVGFAVCFVAFVIVAAKRAAAPPKLYKPAPSAWVWPWVSPAEAKDIVKCLVELSRAKGACPVCGAKIDANEGETE